MQQKMKRIILAAFVFLLFFVGSWFLVPSSDDASKTPASVKNYQELHSAGTQEVRGNTSQKQNDVVFDFDPDSRIGILQINAARRLTVLNRVADKFGFELLYGDGEKSYLGEKIEGKIEGGVEYIFSELLKQVPFRFIKLSEQNDTTEITEKIQICIGNSACSEFQPYNEDAQAFLPHPVKEMLDIKATPEAQEKFDFNERATTLKEQFIYSDLKAKKEILKTLDVNQDIDFFIDIVVFEENPDLRLEAARRLLPTNNSRITSVVLDALNDPDDRFVVDMLGIVGQSKNEELKYQAGTLLDGHSSSRVREAMDKYKFGSY